MSKSFDLETTDFKELGEFFTKMGILYWTTP